jgi:hypothetical protein
MGHDHGSHWRRCGAEEREVIMRAGKTAEGKRVSERTGPPIAHSVPACAALMLAVILIFSSGREAGLSNGMKPESLIIYSRKDGKMITVEKYEETVLERGYFRNSQYDITIMNDREDNEIKHIKGRESARMLEGRMTRKNYETELSLRDSADKEKIVMASATELRGERLDVEFSLEKGNSPAGAFRQSLIAVNTPNKVKVYSEDERDRTTFYILFNPKELRIYGTNRGLAVDYQIALADDNQWITVQDLIIGSINLVLTGHFIF